MQRWQQKQRQRAHHYMVEQAKPTIKRYSKSRQKPNLSSSRSNSINLPFHQVLSILQLQKYESLLISYGFPQRIKEKQSMAYLDQIIKKVQEQDQDKIYSLMNALLSISMDNKSGKKTPLLTKTKNKNLPPTSTSSHIKKSDSMFHKNCDSLQSKKYEKTPQFRIKSKTQLQQQRDYFHSPPVNTFTEKTVLKRQKARDDMSIVHELTLKGVKNVKFITKSNNLLARIQQKLKRIKGKQDTKQQGSKQAQLYYNEIKEMYLSYDSATLTSNIANIDIQEIIQCYALQIEQHLNSQLLNPEKDKKEKINKYKIQKLLKKSLIQNKVQSHATQNSRLDDQINQTISVGSSSEKDEVEESESSQMFNFQKQSIANDLSCFNSQYQSQLQGTCGRKDIKNFIQLVMMAGKMQKQIPIISYAYIRRLLAACKKDQINWKNWKNLTLITLIEASKIWDDQSLQNHSFSKVIQPYTTLQINRLQRHLLTFLNYKLQVEPRQYCQSYFRLRKHATSACKTAHLMHLNLQMIKKLQSGTKKCERSLKQAYKKKLNQSF